jgi:hypothetical protein
MCASSSSLTLVIWGACSNPSRVRLRTPDQWGRVGSQLSAPVFCICGFRGVSAVLALESLISTVHGRGHLWRPFTLDELRGHWSVFAPFEGRFYLSSRLGTLEGLPYLVRDLAI